MSLGRGKRPFQIKAGQPGPAKIPRLGYGRKHSSTGDVDPDQVESIWKSETAESRVGPGRHSSFHPDEWCDRSNFSWDDCRIALGSGLYPPKPLKGIERRGNPVIRVEKAPFSPFGYFGCHQYFSAVAPRVNRLACAASLG